MSELRETDSAGVERHLARNGRVSYLQIPAPDPPALAAFYAAVFGWATGGSTEHVSFRDRTGDLIGAFSPDLEPAAIPGFVPFIYVADIEVAVQSVVAHGGEVAQFPAEAGGLLTAEFRDPAGNHLGLWQSTGE